ncbi:MAG TPA: hypothetical protein VK473_01825 [Terriglobales bacterium]|nr:hypothetical protein [Terriglobales bacterium]
MKSDVAPPTVVSARSSAVLTIFWIGLIAGTLDISDALIFTWLHGVGPARVFQFIASGLIGPRSFQGGVATVLLGVALHYFIALSWTAIFYAASRKLTFLIRRPVISGLLYGVFVYLIMNLVVLPLSRIPHTRPATLASRVNGVLALMLCIGLTISLLVRRNAAPR